MEKTLHYCGASIIDDRHLVTAAHCFKDFGLKEYWKIWPVYNLDSKPDMFKEHTIESLKIHEKYTKPGFQYDIAIIKVAEPFNMEREKVESIPTAMKHQSPKGSFIKKVTFLINIQF